MKSLALALFLALFLALPALAAGPGVLEGKVVNKTPGGGPVGGIEVTLNTYQGQGQGQAQQAPVKARTDANGAFQFTSLNTEASYGYDVTLNYQEADYTSERVSFKEGVTTLALEVPVYESTDNPQFLKVVRSHTVVSLQGKGIAVLEMISLENTGDRTYVGKDIVTPDGRKETLRFPLPRGAGTITPELGFMECCIVNQPGVLLDTMAVPPGTREVAFSYPASGNKVQFQKPVAFPTESFTLLVQDMGAQVEAPGLTPGEPLVIGQASFARYDGLNLAPGQTLSFAVSGLPGPGLAASLRWVLVVALVGALGSALVYALRRRPAPVKTAPQSRQELLLAIARLDEAFEAGQVPEAQYRQQRAQKMARLLKQQQR